MRLINCQTMLFEEFFFKSPPPYAILSHTWEDHEISFKEYYDFDACARHPAAMNKIDEACATARRHDIKYMWIDSCSIDKSSSNEFSEAINSMYQWYRNSERCYVYLSDFESGLTESRATSGMPITVGQIENLKRCKWFGRGWTLQELLAPRQILFYDRNWLFFGQLSELTFAISTITRIPEALLSGKTRIFDYSTAQKMSWAAMRSTTREEDMAYCLFGLFNVNLPLFYGEGARKAFFRLQEAIMKENNDLSLFAWESESNSHYRGILARSPKEFRNAGDVVHLSPVTQNPEFTMTNKGLKIEMMVKKNGITSFMPLNCGVKSGDTVKAYGVQLLQFSGVVVRDLPTSLVYHTASEGTWSVESVYVAKDVRVPKQINLLQYQAQYQDSYHYASRSYYGPTQMTHATAEILARLR